MKRLKDGYLDKIRQSVDLSGKKILEIGCGDGSRSVKIAEYCKQLEAVEPDGALVQLARDRNAASNINYSVGSAEELPFDDDTFDIVIFTLSLHHVSESKMSVAIDEAIRVGKRGGAIIFLEPSFQGNFFEAEMKFDACDGGERREKALAYSAMLSNPRLKEIAEFYDETVFEFDSTDDFIKSLNPKQDIDNLESFLHGQNMRLAAERRINIFNIDK